MRNGDVLTLRANHTPAATFDDGCTCDDVRRRAPPPRAYGAARGAAIVGGELRRQSRLLAAGACEYGAAGYTARRRSTTCRSTRWRPWMCEYAVSAARWLTDRSTSTRSRRYHRRELRVGVWRLHASSAAANFASAANVDDGSCSTAGAMRDAQPRPRHTHRRLRRARGGMRRPTAANYASDANAPAPCEYPFSAACSGSAELRRLRHPRRRLVRVRRARRRRPHRTRRRRRRRRRRCRRRRRQRRRRRRPPFVRPTPLCRGCGGAARRGRRRRVRAAAASEARSVYETLLATMIRRETLLC